MPRSNTTSVASKKPLREKLAIVEEWEKSGESKYVIAKKYGLQSSQITRWARNKSILVERASMYPNNLTLHVGRTVTKPEAEQKLLMFYRQRWLSNQPVTPNILINEALKIDPTFHAGSKKTLSSWVYGFIDRNKLVVSRSKRNSFTEAATRRVQSKPQRATKSCNAVARLGKKASTTKAKRVEETSHNHTDQQRLIQSDSTGSFPAVEDPSMAACRDVRLFKDALGVEHYYAALDLLADPGMARTFIVMSNEDRLGWLQWKLKPAT
ncbi:hypothetical protein DYB32_005490 [Aphanomyces invadans]|uniref:HTH psq-type domain-containing protein n=1 Tax=Aphanomyces invadans TaxID=157072 RepID=A0A418AUF2_9STRA|nr:hypothetical protein DYB32_005490 [Aphanomyces invadans]